MVTFTKCAARPAAKNQCFAVDFGDKHTVAGRYKTGRAPFDAHCRAELGRDDGNAFVERGRSGAWIGVWRRMLKRLHGEDATGSELCRI